MEILDEIVLDIVPDTSLIHKMGRSNFDLTFALGEFIDNAYDARGHVSPVRVDIVTDLAQGRIVICDNSMGMDHVELRTALTLGASTDMAGRIGLFGFGLKAAATFLAEGFTIETTKLGSDHSIRVAYDSRQFTSWDLRGHIVPRIPSLPCGTRITLEPVTVKLGRSELERVKRALAEVYRRLVPDRLVISLNGELLYPKEYELIPGCKWSIDLLVNDKKVKGWVGVHVPPGSSHKRHYTAGFYLYRLDRVVKKGEWIGINYHPRVRNLVGELDLDGFDVTNNKTDFLRDTPDWSALTSSLADLLGKRKLNLNVVAYEKSEQYAADARIPVHEESDEVADRESHDTQVEAQATRHTGDYAPPEQDERVSPGAEDPAPQPPTAGQGERDEPVEATVSSEEDEEAQPTEEVPAQQKHKVFIVHGADHTVRDQCVEVLRDLGLEPVVMEEQPNARLRSLLDKFEDHARQCRYSVVILTPDDMGYCPARGEGPEHAQPRARQNVVFEFGYFVRVSRNRIMCLYKSTPGQQLELPTDTHGLAHIRFRDSVVDVKEQIRRELVAARLLES